MNDPEIMQMFAGVGAIVRDSHFVYSSGRHSSVYINKDALYLHINVISTLCQLMAQPYNADEVDVVGLCQQRQCVQRSIPVIARHVRINCRGVQDLPGAIDDCEAAVVHQTCPGLRSNMKTEIQRIQDR